MSLWDKYRRYELPHIHIGDNQEKNVFEDALSIQAERILNNLTKALPDRTEQEIRQMIFSDIQE